MKVSLKLSSKRLPSGRCQVSFRAKGLDRADSWYGYTTVEPHETLKAVVGRIENRFRSAEDSLSLHQQLLFNLRKAYHRNTSDGIMIFRENNRNL